MRCTVAIWMGSAYRSITAVTRREAIVTGMVFCPDCGVYWAPRSEGDDCWVCGRPGEPHRSPAITCQIAPGDPVPTE